jgi:hypothetical protein
MASLFHQVMDGGVGFCVHEFLSSAPLLSGGADGGVQQDLLVAMSLEIVLLAGCLIPAKPFAIQSF